MAKHFYLILFLAFTEMARAQSELPMVIEEVVVDRQLANFSETQKAFTIKDSVAAENSLTSLLAFNTGVYFKENGFGMVSSASFRGTTAQQTALVWNGIGLNSAFNGQTDFNSFNPRGSEITIRSGGGSALYGSSAIGGSIHLNDKLTFDNEINHSASAGIGSFGSTNFFYRIHASSEQVALKASATYVGSENDFEYPDGSRRNLNGRFSNAAYNIASAYRIDDANVISFYGRSHVERRNFSLVYPTDTPSRYEDFNVASLFEWQRKASKYSSKVKAAWLEESYRFYENTAASDHDHGTSKTFVLKHDLMFKVGKNAKINSVLEYTSASGEGSDIDNADRRTGSVSVHLNHALSEKLLYEASIRKEISSIVGSPLLFSAGSRVMLNHHYSIRANVSRNFRLPTFNDMFWSDGGNTSLKPESSIQGGIGNDIKLKNVEISLTGYYISIRDMIVWLPGTATLWNPQNLSSVTSYGIESEVSWKKKFHALNFDTRATYAYTVSTNDDSGFQLIYVPYHKATGSVAVSAGRFKAAFQALFTGESFIRSDNNPRYVTEAYTVSNLHGSFAFGHHKNITAGIHVRNLFNRRYEMVENRPSPGRNFNFQLTINF